jgi:hypothetical protein
VPFLSHGDFDTRKRKERKQINVELKGRCPSFKGR